MTDGQIAWLAIYDHATVSKATAGDRPFANQIPGRAITYIVHKLNIFWGRHKARLIPFMTNLAIAALEAMVTAEPDIQAINPPGPP